jgi:hypothetical protein
MGGTALKIVLQNGNYIVIQSGSRPGDQGRMSLLVQGRPGLGDIIPFDMGLDSQLSPLISNQSNADQGHQ